MREPQSSPNAKKLILDQVEPHRVAVYDEVRGVVDRFADAAPWSVLLDPPDRIEALEGLESRFLRVLADVPGAMTASFDRLRRDHPDAARQTELDRMESNLESVWAMVAAETAELRTQIAAARLSGKEPALALARHTTVVDIMLDLQGKVTSLLMRFAATCVADDRWDPTAVEAILFVEKDEEHRRNRHLVEALRHCLAAIEQVTFGVDFLELLDRWSSARRAERYALDELSSLRNPVAKLAHGATRRALFAGDAREIETRTSQLFRRIHRLEELHRSTWSGPTGDLIATKLYPQLEKLTLEVAAQLDHNLLEMLLGRGRVRELRAQAQESLVFPDDPNDLTRFVGRGDLRSFLESLESLVLQRGSLRTETVEIDDIVSATSHRQHGQPAAEVDATNAEAPSKLDRLTVEEAFSASEKAHLRAITPRPDDPTSSGMTDSATTQTTTGRRPGPRSLYQRMLDLEEVHRMIDALRAPESHGWQAIHRLERMLEAPDRGSVVGAAALKRIVDTYLFDVLNRLVPRLEAAGEAGDLPEDASTKLVRVTLLLSEIRGSDEGAAAETAKNLRRLTRLLDGLAGSVAPALGGLKREAKARLVEN